MLACMAWYATPRLVLVLGTFLGTGTETNTCGTTGVATGATGAATTATDFLLLLDILNAPNNGWDGMPHQQS